MSLSSNLFLAVDFPDWRIDPDGGWLGWRIGRFFDEAFGVCGVGEIEDFLAGFVDRVGLAVVNLVRRHQSDAGVMMIALGLAFGLLEELRKGYVRSRSR